MPYFSYHNLTFKWIKVVWCSRIYTLISMSGSRAPQTPPSCFGVWRDGIRVRDSPRSFESEPELGTVWERRRQRLKKWLAIRQDQRKRHCQRGGHSGNVGGAAPSDGIRYDAAPSEAVIDDVTEVAIIEVPIIEVAYTHDKWWSLPPNTSAELYAAKVNN